MSLKDTDTLEPQTPWDILMDDFGFSSTYRMASRSITSTVVWTLRRKPTHPLEGIFLEDILRPTLEPLQELIATCERISSGEWYLTNLRRAETNLQAILGKSDKADIIEADL